MTFSEAAKILNIKNYPEELNEIWDELSNGKIESPLTKELLIRLEERFSFFNKFYDEVLLGFEELKSDEAKYIWTHSVCIYAKKHGRDEVKALQIPVTDGSLSGNLAPLFVLLVSAEDAYEEYIRRGFPEEEVRQYLTVYNRGTGNLYGKTGKPGLSGFYFNWVNIYTYAEIFHAGGFQFQFAKNSKAPRVLKNKVTGEMKILLADVSFHKEGLRLGSAGFEDEEGSFTTFFEESEISYKGFPVENGRCKNELKEFSKAEWELYLKPNDGVLAMHIPRGTDISKENVFKAISLAKQIAKERFPDKEVKEIQCSSWLLSFDIEKLLGESASISKFANLFSRFPIKCNGDSVFSFVFSSKPTDLNLLPEETSLQKKLKELYLSGSFALNSAGFLFE